MLPLLKKKISFKQFISSNKVHGSNPGYIEVSGNVTITITLPLLYFSTASISLLELLKCFKLDTCLSAFLIYSQGAQHLSKLSLR